MLYHPDINVLIWGGLSEKVKIGYYTSDLSKSSSSFRQESSLYIVMTSDGKIMKILTNQSSETVVRTPSN